MMIRPSVVVVIGEVNSHPGIGLPFGVDRYAGVQTNFFKCPIALLVKEELGHGIVRDKQIDAPVAIVIGDGHAQRFCRLVEPQFVRAPR